MAYDKGQIQELAVAILNTVDAVKDGVDVTDVNEAISLLTAFGGASDEIRTDTDAALLHLGSSIMGLVGDRRIDAPEV